MKIIKDNTIEELMSCELIKNDFTVKVLRSINGNMFYATIVEETDTTSEMIYKTKWYYDEIDAKQDAFKYLEDK